jgi:hypothetical protein
MFTEPLPCNDRRNIHTDTQTEGGFFKYAVEVGSGVMIYIPSFIKIGPAMRKLVGRDTQTHRQHGDGISLHLFFQNKESRLKSEGNNTDM